MRTLWRIHVRSIAIALSFAVLTAGCEQSTDPLLFGVGGSGGLTQAQATGNWSFVVTQSALACASGSLANGQAVTAHLDVLTAGALSTASFWQSPLSTASLSITGSITLGTGATDLFLSSSAGGTMELNGTMTSTGTFTGTLTDPAAGVVTPVFSACIYSTTGTKTG
jgi:hypothetical protein